VTSGSVQSKLNNYFDKACFTTPSIIGADGVGTAFGNSATGIVNGPGQANLDLSLTKTFPLHWPQEGGSLQFRAEFFNALNHPQFADPDNNFSSATFGVISNTSVNPRVGQLALKFSFEVLSDVLASSLRTVLTSNRTSRGSPGGSAS